MGKKKIKNSKFHIEYGKTKNKCSNCRYLDYYGHYGERFRTLKHFWYCFTCSLSASKDKFERR